MRPGIRWRLAFWNALALAVALLGFAALVYGLVSQALYQQLDRKLLAAWERLERDEHLADDRDGRLRYWIEEFHEHDELFAVVYGPGGKALARSEVLAEDSVPAMPDAAGGREFDDWALPIVGRQRVLTGRLALGGEEFTAALMAPLAEVDRELGDLLAALTVAVPMALALSVGLAYLLARKALAPVERLRARTEEITADWLDRRLPVDHPGDELGRLARTINAMIARLERSFEEVRRFTADASHELRTPLTALRTEVEVALGKPMSREEHQHLLGSVLEECGRLTRLTDQLLALSREDAGAARRAHGPVDLAPVLGAVVDNMRPLAEAQGLRLSAELDGPARVSGDETRLREVFYNLIENGIKYTPAGGAVEVRLGRHDGKAVVSVRDTGIGIAPEHQQRVFDRFYRVDKVRGRAEGGTGLGLSIARSIVAAHRGTITLESTLGQGTTCTVTLPAD